MLTIVRARTIIYVSLTHGRRPRTSVRMTTLVFTFEQCPREAESKQWPCENFPQRQAKSNYLSPEDEI